MFPPEKTAVSLVCHRHSDTGKGVSEILEKQKKDCSCEQAGIDKECQAPDLLLAHKTLFPASKIRLVSSMNPCRGFIEETG